MLRKYIVIELQTAADGSVGNIVSTYDELPDAESKYHLILSAAAVSAIAEHAAVLMTSEGYVLETKCYTHEGGDN